MQFPLEDRTVLLNARGHVPRAMRLMGLEFDVFGGVTENQKPSQARTKGFRPGFKPDRKWADISPLQGCSRLPQKLNATGAACEGRPGA